MSADAKAWQDENGWWQCVHDGDCAAPHDRGTSYDLASILRDIEACMHHPNMRWEIRVYPNGETGLVGYTW